MINIKNRRNVEDLFQDNELPSDFSAHEVKNQCREEFSTTFFNCQNDMLRIIAQKAGFDISKIVIKLANGVDFTQQQFEMLNKILCEVIQGQLRKTDQVLDKIITESEFAIVLPGTSVANAQIVINKIKESLKQHNSAAIENVDYCFSAESLYQLDAA